MRQPADGFLVALCGEDLHEALGKDLGVFIFVHGVDAAAVDIGVK
jgi:hypothetical protein